MGPLFDGTMRLPVAGPEARGALRACRLGKGGLPKPRMGPIPGGEWGTQVRRLISAMLAPLRRGPGHDGSLWCQTRHMTGELRSVVQCRLR